MERWKLWIEHNRPFIEGYVRSVGFRLLKLGEEFLKAQGSMLDYLRDKFRDRKNHWLTIINRLVYNTGASLEPWPPSAPYGACTYFVSLSKGKMCIISPERGLMT